MLGAAGVRRRSSWRAVYCACSPSTGRRRRRMRQFVRSFVRSFTRSFVRSFVRVQCARQRSRHCHLLLRAQRVSQLSSSILSPTFTCIVISFALATRKGKLQSIALLLPIRIEMRVGYSPVAERRVWRLSATCADSTSPSHAPDVSSSSSATWIRSNTYAANSRLSIVAVCDAM